MENEKTGFYDGTLSGPVSPNTMTGQRTKPTDEEAILARCRKGNMVAYGQLIELYQDRLFNAILRMTGNYDDALEITQEAFFRALKNIGRFRGNAGFYTWLFRIGINLCLNHRRRAAKVRFIAAETAGSRHDSQANNLFDLLEAHDSRPEEQAQLHENHHRALAAMARLDEEHRTVMVLRDIEGLNYNQIARVLEQPVGTIKSRLSRARAAVRDFLSQNNHE